MESLNHAAWRALVHKDFEQMYGLIERMYPILIQSDFEVCNVGFWGDSVETQPARAQARRILDLTGAGPGTRLLELPCAGGGYATIDHPAAQAEWLGIDMQEQRIAEARERHRGRTNIRYEVCDAADVGTLVPTDTLDVALLVEILPDLGLDATLGMIEAVAKCVRPGGRLILTDFFMNHMPKTAVEHAAFAVYARLLLMHQPLLSDVLEALDSLGFDITAQHDWTDSTLVPMTEHGLEGSTHRALRDAGIPWIPRRLTKAFYRSQRSLLRSGALGYHAVVATKREHVSAAN